MLRLTSYIAWRYLFSRKEKTVVNLISWISLVGITVSTVALVVVMSVYNGIGQLTQSLFNVFDPELIVEPSEGKTFHTSDIDYSAMKSVDGVASVSEIVEENAWITHRQAESIVQLRGVDEGYAAGCGLDTMVSEGVFLLKEDVMEVPQSEEDGVPLPAVRNYLVMGGNIMYRMGFSATSNVPLAVHIPKRGTTTMGFSIDDAFNNGYAYAAGAFHLQEDIDNMYVVADIDFVRRLMSYAPDEVTALAISLVPSAESSLVKKRLRSFLGDSFTVKDRYEQKPLYYKIFHPKWLIKVVQYYYL